MTVSQFFVYKRPIAWTLLVFTLLAGAFAYRAMPQRQDPLIQIRAAMVVTAYPGASPLEVEQEVTRKIEKRIAECAAVEHVNSISKQGVSLINIELFETTKNAAATWQDLEGRLATIADLPTVNMVPVKPVLNKDYADSVAVMLTLSSPPLSDFEVDERARIVGQRIDAARDELSPAQRESRFSWVLVHPSTIDPSLVERLSRLLLQALSEQGLAQDGHYLGMLGAGVIDFQLPPHASEAALRAAVHRWEHDKLAAGLGHPDVWPPLVIGKTSDLAGEMKRLCQSQPGGVARYSYAELHRFADALQDRLRQSPRVGRIEQVGVLEEAIYLYFSNRRLSPSGIDVQNLAQKLVERNITQPGGTVDLPQKTLTVQASGKFENQTEFADTIVAVKNGVPLYLRDLVETVRGYEDPARILNFQTEKETADQTDGNPGLAAERAAEHGATGPAQKTKLWTTRAITLSVRQIASTQIADFGRDVDAAISSLRGVLPDDLRVERTSDEPERVARKIELFDDCFIEAVAIVVIISLIFMEWRSALLIAISIPITVAMTLAFCLVLGVDLQQISIAALIIALGLLVDDPVVAGDAINREMAHGAPRDVAAWQGPQKLSRAILYATVTNCVAFLPLLVCSGVVGEFIWSLPVVVTASLVASRIVSMTFIPLLGYYLLRGQHGFEAGLAGGDVKGSKFARLYNGFSELCMEHKWTSMAACLVVLGAALSLAPLIGTNFFPKDLHTAFTVNLYLPEGAPVAETKAEAFKTIDAIERLVGPEVKAYTTFVGAGGPRFWISIVPEQSAPNYAQIMVHTRNVRATQVVAARLKQELPGQISSGRIHVQELESGPPIGIPVQVRIFGPDAAELRRLGEELKGFMREYAGTENLQDDWDPEYLQLRLDIDPERASEAGVSNQDVARLMSGGLSGSAATYLRERDRLIPINLRLRPDERGSIEDMRTMGIYSPLTTQWAPLDQIGKFRSVFVAPKICRRDHERCMTVKCDTGGKVLASRVVDFLDAKLQTAIQHWPAGYHYNFGGEKEQQDKGFGSMKLALIISVVGIYLALVLQFNSLAKPLVVFAAVPFGMVGGMMGLLAFNVPLGFFALLGLSSLAGVIISHVIVLFEYIEEAHERGEPLRRAVIDAALVRLRPVLVTVLATVGGLIPLVNRGGPLWEPLCYVQIMGLLTATLVTKIVVPVLYVLFVENFKLIRWDTPAGGGHAEAPLADGGDGDAPTSSSLTRRKAPHLGIAS